MGTRAGSTNEALPPMAGHQADLDSLSAAHGDRYRFQLDHRDPGRPARFIAIARTLNVSPSLAITDDPAELHDLLSAQAAPAEGATGD
jgi:ABC-type oligopeptide transport system ATPase subunit